MKIILYRNFLFLMLLTLSFSCSKDSDEGGVIGGEEVKEEQIEYTRNHFINAPSDNSIQAVVDRARKGDTITLSSGTHRVSTTVFFNKPIIIIGEDAENTVVEKHNGYSEDIVAFWIDSDSVVMKNFELDGRGLGGPGIIIKTNNNLFENIYLHNCGNDDVKSGGFIFDNAFLNIIRNSRADNNRMVGFSQNDSADNEFHEVSASGNGAEGLTIDIGSHNCIVKDSSFSGNNAKAGGVGGIGIDDSNGALIDNCLIEGTLFEKSGITFQNNVGPDDGCRIWNSTFRNNSLHGVFLRNCNYPVTNLGLQDNVFENNGAEDVKWQCQT
ncbi:hypothetical protein G3I01_03900 [Gramella sp. MT6]|uniref:right-handed parallel beta-helix repeat-containing protein n=1 Tax=Gramella sp. MT6 TaxID=2705471 RepID=UPI001C5D5624|nr:right-handed parallel beta-helix repeat-containing protein [Gramella sp. MT6]QYA24687.1 hypothetical protein G3I01_03900 [Gramella sp. MT6]